MKESERTGKTIIVNHKTHMNQDSVVLITGANSGIGKAASLELAKTGATIVMLCRDRQRGEDALKEVRIASGSKNVELMLCNLASFKSIRNFAEEFKKRYQKLHVLINNAAVIQPGYHLTADGIELQFGVNHLGHFLLTHELLNLMIASAPARIINVSSGAHKWGKIDFEDINFVKKFSFWRAYGRSKLANVLFTYELARRLNDKNIAANCLHPGAVATQLGINRDTGFGKIITGLLKPFFRTPAQGAETLIYLATQSENPKLTGKYFVNKKPEASSKVSYDKDLATRLWEVSEKLTGIV